MNKQSALIALSFTLISFAGYAQSSKTKEVIKQMEATGKLKRMGNTLEFQMDKPSDTVQVRKKYENVFKKPDGSNYEIKFFIDPKYIQNNKQVPVNKLPQNNQPVNNVAGTPGAPVTGSINSNNQGCFPNMLVFGESGYREEIKKYEWVVPQGIYKIKMECWTGGGDGFMGVVVSDSAGNLIGARNGGGGGGGAYALAIIDIKPGDILKMNIPGGGSGKSILIQVNDILNSLLIGNGSDGKPGNQNGSNGMGGFVNYRNVRGVFAGKTISFNGENGFFNTYISSNVGSTIYGSEYCGNGGAAAKLNNGGRGFFEAGSTSLGNFFSHTASGSYSVNSTNGGFPGGGGGAGYSNLRIPGAEIQGSKGAPGVVIIYY